MDFAYNMSHNKVLEMHCMLMELPMSSEDTEIWAREFSTKLVPISLDLDLL